MSKLEAKRFDQPDEVRPFTGHGHVDLVELSTGPVGLGTISAAIYEEKDSIEEIIEPYLIQIGFLNRTPRGRMVTRLAYQHFGLEELLKPNVAPSLFD